MRQLVRDLALALRERVLPHLGSHAARAHEAEAATGDVTFAIDAEAERELEAFLLERAPDVAFYSEDRGLVEPSGGARTVLVSRARGSSTRCPACAPSSSAWAAAACSTTPPTT